MKNWPLPIKIGLWIMAFMVLLGLLVGTLNITSPDSVHIPFGPDGEGAEGLDGIIASLASSTVLGLVLAIPAMFFSWLVLGSTGKGRKS